MSREEEKFQQTSQNYAISEAEKASSNDSGSFIYKLVTSLLRIIFALFFAVAVGVIVQIIILRVPGFSMEKQDLYEIKFTDNGIAAESEDWIDKCSHSEEVCSQIGAYFGSNDAIIPYLKNPNLLLNDVGKNFIFHGKPGTGKSRCALIIAKNISSSYIIIPAGNLQQKYVGSGASVWRKILSVAKEKAKNARKPVVIIVEEIDSLAMSKSREGDDTLVNTFLQSIDSIQKDELKIIIIGTTNRIGYMEPASVRTGRFNRLLFEYPDEKGLDKILKEIQSWLKKSNFKILSENEKKKSEQLGNYGFFFDDNYWSSLKTRIMDQFKSEGGYSVTYSDIYSCIIRLFNEEARDVQKRKSGEWANCGKNASVIVFDEFLAEETCNLLSKVKKEDQETGTEGLLTRIIR